VTYKLDDDDLTFTTAELLCLNEHTHVPVRELRALLAKIGLRFVPREPERRVRGFTTSSHDRWYGPGADKTHGGSGFDNRE
jgi:hypothetical protein